MKGPSTGFMSLKNLDDFEVWPIKHRHWTFEVVEDEAQDVWISTRDLRFFYARLPKDDVLKTRYQRTSLYAKDAKTFYLSERIMRLELAKSKAYSEHTDVLKFLDWFDRNVSQVAAKKRGNKKLDHTNAQREIDSAQIQMGPLPAALAPSHLDASTMPLEEGEQWRLNQDADAPRKVFHPEAMPVRTSWDDWAKEQMAKSWGYALSFFRGERNLFLTFGFCLLVAMLSARLEAFLFLDSLDWPQAFKRVLWSQMLLMVLALCIGLGIACGLTRSAIASFKKTTGLLWGGTFYLLTIWLSPLIFLNFFDLEKAES